MDPLREIDIPLLERYLAAETTESESVAVERWLAADPGRTDVVRAIREGRRLRNPVDPAAEWSRLETMLRTPQRPRPHVGGRSSRRTSWQWIWPSSALVVLLAVLALFKTGAPHDARPTRRYATGVDQQGIVMLDDGTRVTLAPQTTLQLIAFSRNRRTVSVDGKAYFEVAHAQSAPFEVRTGSVTTRVLGTEFLVDHSVQNSRVRVAVAEGKVQMITASRAHGALMVTAGYVGEITDSSNSVAAVADSASGAASGTEWLHGQLVFHHMPVETVLQTLSRWYGYQFRYADSTLPRRTVTIWLSTRSAASAFATLEQILRVNLAIAGDTVTLTPHADERESRTPRVRSYDVWTPTREVGR